MLMSISRDWHGERLEEGPKEVQRHLTQKSESKIFIKVLNIHHKPFDFKCMFIVICIKYHLI